MGKPLAEVWEKNPSMMRTYPSVEGHRLLQQETGEIFDDVIDYIVGFREEDGKQVPYSQYTYVEFEPEKE